MGLGNHEASAVLFFAFEHSKLYVACLVAWPTGSIFASIFVERSEFVLFAICVECLLGLNPVRVLQGDRECGFEIRGAAVLERYHLIAAAMIRHLIPCTTVNAREVYRGLEIVHGILQLLVAGTIT